MISLAPCADAALDLRANHRMSSGRVAADDHDHVGVVDGVEVLGAGRSAESGAQAIAGGGVADAGAGVHVVVAEAAADQLLDEVGFFGRAARGGQAAQGVLAVLLLDALELGGDAADGLFPAHLTPRIGDFARGSSAW